MRRVFSSQGCGLDFRERQHLFGLESVRCVEINGDHVGDGQELVESLQRVVGNDFAVIDDDDAVAEALGFFHVVRGVD